MIVCVCMAVSGSQIDQAIKEGAKNIGEVQEKTGIGMCCGICLYHLDEELKRKKEENKDRK